MRAVADAPGEVSVDVDEAEEMSTELLIILQMNPTEVPTEAVPRGWPWLMMHEDSLPGLLQPDKGPVHHGDGSLAVEGVETSHAVLCN